jgi:hypothetical protein
MISSMRRMALLLATLMCVGASAGCGETAVPGAAAHHTTTVGGSRTPSKVSGRPDGVVARIDASSDRIIAEGKVHIASGAPSDAEVRRELRAARKAGIKLPTGESAASFENAPSNSGGPAAEAEVPEAVWNPHSKPIADWIIPVLQWAYQHGWRGVVTSGYRTFYEQAQLNAAGAYSAKAGLSNHETTKYPGGAVDVTDSAQLIEVLRPYPGPLKLVGGVLGPVDPEHFSATGD